MEKINLKHLIYSVNEKKSDPICKSYALHVDKNENLERQCNEHKTRNNEIFSKSVVSWTN